ncbi:quinone-dependent dihydroorotate dehydrogenase [Thalassoroseus pseudoceratinae]|uniref:quinone-dependent dihydroorotate dehydrogenase n=1 Tax=Thalassoroseus pseudoceratinae TaxID=2713176 RepID=UPI00197F8B6A|nr:quinone-dependent dihydroorotate dehydrogenase [Thalassoroseus pseudoceratinae]
MFLRPLLFQLDPETAHNATVSACRVAAKIPLLPWICERSLTFRAPELCTEVAGLRFPNPIGLAAGWDKSGKALNFLDRLGFGTVEIGSVSACPSEGNPKPRLFRLPDDRAIQVHYGLPNDGVETVADRVESARLRIPVGVNLVATNHGPQVPASSEEEILDDYATSIARVHAYADYLTLNLSCPNAEGGRDVFSEPGTLRRLLERVQPLNVACPVFLKVAPETDAKIHERWLMEIDPFECVKGFMFNLPSGQPRSLKLKTPANIWKNRPGAIAGRPVADWIDRCIASLYPRLDHSRQTIIGSGGVFSGEDAYRKIRLGASIVQIYTAMIYEGPKVVTRINRELLELLRRDGFECVQDAVGVGV